VVGQNLRPQRDGRPRAAADDTRTGDAIARNGWVVLLVLRGGGQGLDPVRQVIRRQILTSETHLENRIRAVAG
jgi:hypothetical protein